MLLMGSGQLWVCFGAGWDWFCPTEGQLMFSSHKHHHCSCAVPKTLLQNPNTGTNDTIRGRKQAWMGV